MAAELFQLPLEAITQRITDLLTILGLGHRIHYKPDSLSGGQKQRVAIARALVHRPPLILADEPTSGLDDSNAEKVLRLLKASAKDKTLIVVSHDARVRQYFDLKIDRFQ
jgi:putative ABC transport system ATP-binding protein